MEHVLQFGERSYISAADAAKEAGCTRDYVALLCRRETVPGQRVGRNWYVDQAAFRSYLVSKQYKLAKNNARLAAERAHAYHGGSNAADSAVEPLEASWARYTPKMLHAASGIAATPAGMTEAALRTGQGLSSIPVHTIASWTEFLHRFTALLGACVIVGSVYSLINPSYAEFAFQSFKEVATSARHIDFKDLQPSQTVLEVGEDAKESLSKLSYRALIGGAANVLQTAAAALQATMPGSYDTAAPANILIRIEPYEASRY